MTTRLTLLALLFAACGPADQLEVDGASSALVITAPQDPSCPATWAEARRLCNDTPCTTLNQRCWYPGVGDQLPSGEWAPGLLSCFDQSGGTSGIGEWRCAQ
jgi:hypothetical protein